MRPGRCDDVAPRRRKPRASPSLLTSRFSLIGCRACLPHVDAARSQGLMPRPDASHTPSRRRLRADGAALTLGDALATPPGRAAALWPGFAFFPAAHFDDHYWLFAGDRREADAFRRITFRRRAGHMGFIRASCLEERPAMPKFRGRAYGFSRATRHDSPHAARCQHRGESWYQRTLPSRDIFSSPMASRRSFRHRAPPDMSSKQPAPAAVLPAAAALAARQLVIEVTSGRHMQSAGHVAALPHRPAPQSLNILPQDARGVGDALYH